MTAQIYRTESKYFTKLLGYHGVAHHRSAAHSSHLYFDGYTDYNHLVTIDNFFKKKPNGDITDRTLQTSMPYKLRVMIPYQDPIADISVDDFFQRRISYIESISDRINIMYSGGIDSTAIVAGVIKYGDTHRYRILHNQDSIEENPDFYQFIKTTDLELVQLSEYTFSNNIYDGLFVSGNGMDSSVGQLDPSFMEDSGTFLKDPWQDYFYSRCPDQKFMDFCEEFMARTAKPIHTVLEACWWYYHICRICLYPVAGWLQPESPQGFVTLNDGWPCPLGFYECADWQAHSFFNTHMIMPTDDYSSYKYEIKKFIHSVDGNTDYFQNKIKRNSTSLAEWRTRNVILKNKEYIMLLDNGEKITTDNLPLLSAREYRKKYGNRLDYLFTSD